jgi:DNA-binding NtrC family response regulator
MKAVKVLIAEDNDLNRLNLSELLSDNDFEVMSVRDGKEAMELFSREKFDVVITDLKMPHVDGIQLLAFIKELNEDTVVIIMTGYATVSSAVEAMKLGAFDYITKPLRDDIVLLTLQRAISFVRLKEENTALRDHLRKKYDFGKMTGYSESMKKVFETIKKVSSTDSTVIIYGESGTGKELAAKAIHFNSDRRSKPLVTVNCGAIPEELLESELFGHEKGAFTGAIRSRIGRFELAQEGSIFLDEIGDMSPSLQVKLLRVLQERQFERIGGMRTLEADVRIIAATHRNLEDAVRKGKFREDLYYRINVIPIHLPPLRERKADIPVLIGHFLKTFNTMKKKRVTAVTDDAMDRMINYGWPGNVRELQNTMEMLVVMKEEGMIDMDDLPERIYHYGGGTSDTASEVDIPEGGINLNQAVTQFEKNILLKALEKSGGVKNKAAQLLKLNRTTYVEKLKRYNIS